MKKSYKVFTVGVLSLYLNVSQMTPACCRGAGSPAVPPWAVSEGLLLRGCACTKQELLARSFGEQVRWDAGPLLDVAAQIGEVGLCDAVVSAQDPGVHWQ